MKNEPIFYYLNGRSQTRYQWAKEYGIAHKTLSARLKVGVPLLEALTRPSARKRDGLTKAQRRRQRGRAFLDAQKSKPCCDCGRAHHPWVMEFDHRLGEGKAYNVSEMVCKSPAAILREIAKCDLVCANCHRERSYRRSVDLEGDPMLL